MNNIYVLDQNFELQGIIDEYVSVIWRPSYSEVGDFEIYLGATDKAISLLQKNRYVVRSCDISVENGITTYKKVMVIKNLQLITNVENGDFYCVTGRELKYLLHQRIVWSQTNLSGTAENAMRRLVNENAINPTDTNRVIPKLLLGEKYELSNWFSEKYTRLDYIECTGTQWINTGFIPDQDTRIVCEFMWLGGNGIYGTRQSTSSRNFALRAISNNFQPGYHTVLGSTGIKTDDEWHIADQNKNMFYLDGVLAREFNYVTFTGPKAIGIGCINANNQVYYGEGRYRTCQIYDNGVLVRDLIPCQKKSDGEIGMYDVLNDVFYTNAGSGEFVSGEVIDSPIEDLEKSIDKQVTGDHLDTVISEICNTYNYGWDIFITNNTMAFIIYAGSDRSYGQTERPYVVFSDEFENLYNTDYQLITEEYANTTLIGGEGEGVERIYTTVNNSNSGLERYETFTDARDVSQNKDSEDEIDLTTYLALLQARGRENLASLTYTEGFSGEVLSDVAFKYGKDFYLGDLVTVINKYGIQKNVRVLSAIESEDESGTKLLPQFNI